MRNCSKAQIQSVDFLRFERELFTIDTAKCCSQQVMHSSRIRTARSLIIYREGGFTSRERWSASRGGESASRGRGVCIQGGGGSASRERGSVSGIEQTPPVNRQTGAKTLPCPKLRLWAVLNYQ